MDFWLDLELFMFDISVRNMEEHRFGLIEEKLMIYFYGYMLVRIYNLSLGCSKWI